MSKKQTAAPNEVGGRSISGWIIAGVALVVVALAAVITIVSTDDAPNAVAGLSQTQPVTVSGTALPAFTADAADPAIGTAAPTLEGAEFGGSAIAVKPGRPTLVIFLAHWCPHCRREVPVLTQWQQNGGVPDGVDVIGVATGTDTTLPNYPPSEWLTDEKFPFPVMADSPTFDAAHAYGLSGYPYFVLLDADGRVLQRASGEIDPATLTPVLEGLVTS